MKATKRLETGDQVRMLSPLFQQFDEIEIPSSPKQLELTPIPLGRAVLLNELWHSRLPLFGGTSRICYGAIFNDWFFASAIWSQPVARMLPQDTHLELRRFAISPDAPFNTATRILRLMRQDIKTQFPEVTTLISYQDTDAHSGTIYKADNWVAMHHERGNREWSTPSRLRRKTQTRSPKIRWERAA